MNVVIGALLLVALTGLLARGIRRGLTCLGLVACGGCGFLIGVAAGVVVALGWFTGRLGGF